MTPAQCKALLSKNDKGAPYANHANVVFVLQHAEAYSAGRFWYDEFLDRIFVANSPTRLWRDDDDTRVTVDLQENFGMISVHSHVTAAAVQYVARQRTRHVVRDWLLSLAWDGIPRIATAFEDYWGAASDDYTHCASRNFLIGMAARILRPGCKLDTMPVFEGAQGIRKSSALQILGGQWYSTAHESVSSKDFLQGFRGKWLLEIAELQSFTRAEVNAVKTMMSSPVDDYRPSYGHHVVSFPRQNVLAGTTNADDWGDDATGLRRFWPIKCGEIRLDLLAAAREQLFAEAVAAVQQGADWWVMPAETATIQASRQFHDEWTDTVLAYCDRQLWAEGVRIRDVLVHGLKVSEDRIDKRMQMRVGAILKIGGWLRKTGRTSEGLAKVWHKVDSSGGNF